MGGDEGFSWLPCCSPCLSECHHSVFIQPQVRDGFLLDWLGSPFWGFTCLFSGLSLGPRLIGLLELHFPYPGLRVVFACLFACISWLLLLGPPFPFMVAVPDVLGALGLAC